jgi:hypothetical protein
MGLAENGWFSSFALLSPTTFLITTASNISPILPTEPRSIASVFPPVIQIYSFSPNPATNINPVQPLSAETSDDTTPRPVLVAQFNLPEFVPGELVASFDIRPDPAFPPISPDTKHTLGERKPFTQDPTKGVVVFELSVVDPPDPIIDFNRVPDGENFEMFMLRETLVGIASEGEERLRRSRLPVGDKDRLEVWDVARTWKWEEWGEEHTRFTEMTMARRHWVSKDDSGFYSSSLPSYEVYRRSADVSSVAFVLRGGCVCACADVAGDSIKDHLARSIGFWEAVGSVMSSELLIR